MFFKHYLAILCVLGVLVPQREASLDFVGVVGSKVFFLENSAQVSWVGAWQACHNAGMSLAALSTGMETHFIDFALQNHTGYWWVAASNFGSPGTFFWMNKENGGNVLEPNRWIGDPNVSSPSCMQMYTSNGWLSVHWYFADCTGYYPFLCQIG